MTFILILFNTNTEDDLFSIYKIWLNENSS